MERLFQILAVILGGVAAYFLWQGNADYTFAAVVFAAVSFFLSLRFQIKDRLSRHEAERRAEEEKWSAKDGEFEEIEEDELEEDPETPLLHDIPASKQLDKDRRTTDNEQRI
jgi:hypothetical protein